MGNLPYADTRTLTPLRQDCTGSNESEMHDMPTVEAHALLDSRGARGDRFRHVKVGVTVNEMAQDHDVEARTLLVHYLREACALTGTKVGCDTSSCGACTVLVNGESVKSCTMLAAQADGATVTTIEGLADGVVMHPVQQAFHEHHGLQCGYCTPGMVMAAVSLLEEIPDPTERDVRIGIEGNLCRCTGYHNIVESVLAAAEQMRTQPR
jgi:carbon-monoxide dehydrogenase small subunit